MALLVVLSTALQVISKEKVTRLMVHGGKIQAEMVVGKSISAGWALEEPSRLCPLLGAPQCR